MIGPLQRQILEALVVGPATVSELEERAPLPQNWRRTGPATYGIASITGLCRRGFIARERYDLNRARGHWCYIYTLTRQGRAELGLPEPDAPKLGIGGTDDARRHTD